MLSEYSSHIKIMLCLLASFAVVFCLMGCSNNESNDHLSANALAENSSNANNSDLESANIKPPEMEPEYKEKVEEESVARVEEATKCTIGDAEVELWTTPLNSVLQQTVGESDQASCETGPMTQVTDMYYEGYEQDSFNAYGGFTNSSSSFDCPVSELKDKKVPAKGYIAISIDNGEWQFSVTAVNREDSEKAAGDCPVVELSVDTEDGTAKAPSLRYNGIGIGSTQNDAVSRMGQPYDETYGNNAIWAYYMDHGDVELAFAKGVVSSVAVSNLYMMDTTKDAELNPDFLNAVRSSDERSWETLALSVAGVNVSFGSTTVGDLARSGIAFENDLSQEAFGDTSVLFADGSGYIVCRGTDNSKIETCPVIGIYANGDTDNGVAQTVSIGGFNLESSRDMLPNLFGKPNHRAGASYFWEGDSAGTFWTLQVLLDGKDYHVRQIRIESS